jgi:hypothetical protein
LIIIGGLGVGGQRGHAERFGEDIAPLTDGSAIAGNVKEHPPIVVEAIAADEVNAMPGQVQPLLTRLDGVIQVRQQPGDAPLLPHSLVVVDEGSVPIHGRYEAAVFPVDAAGKPKGQRVMQQPIPIDGDQFIDALG